MKVLHITNDYSGSTVYKNLVSSLDELGVEQIIYNPIKEKKRLGVNFIEFKESSQIIYSLILNKTTDRIFYRKKIKKILKDIETKIDLSKIKMIHAHTWYSDGGVAYLLSQKYNIPYIVTIRNSDLNVFYKYLVQERNFGIKIIKKAEKIVFISEIYRKRFLNYRFYSDFIDKLKFKLLIIPNGVDKFWIENNLDKKRNIDEVFKILYVGKFDKDKNVLRLIEAVNKVNKSFSCELSIVGGEGNQEKKVLEKINSCSFVKYYGLVYNKFKLLDIYRKNDLFAMPSKAETFGLVYIEALIQGLPIINTINEGIYGMYENTGESVNYKSVQEIADAIIKIKTNYAKYQFDKAKILKNHNWHSIGEKYLNIYQECI